MLMMYSGTVRRSVDRLAWFRKGETPVVLREFQPPTALRLRKSLSSVAYTSPWCLVVEGN